MADDVPKLQLGNVECSKHNHKRSNVETTFHMLKTEFGDSVTAKNEPAQFNETLLKILCHHVVVAIHEMKESDIDPGFLSGESGVRVRSFNRPNNSIIGHQAFHLVGSYSPMVTDKPSFRGDSDQPFILSYDGIPEDPVELAVPKAVAAIENQDPSELPALATVVDPEAIARVTEWKSSSDFVAREATFEYYGYRITIDSNSNIRILPAE